MLAAPHIPVLLGPILAGAAPVSGLWLDGTFGNGGYSYGLLAAGAARVIGIDRDPDVIARATGLPEAITLIKGRFGELDQLADAPLDGVVLDIGVSSMQIDEGARGFSFMRDGPLDMRMSQSGPSAADIVNRGSETLIADILYRFGEERKSRRIARAIVAARTEGAITTTLQLADIIKQNLPYPKPGQPHPATRSFQALRIAVNDELGELARGLGAAERALKPGGLLVVVTFHSLEDRMVKRFMQLRSGNAPRANRYAPEAAVDAPRFEKVTRKAIEADAEECAANPRARSARLRIARRLSAPATPIDPHAIGMPEIDLGIGGIL
ncbi:MAG: 16S rRNA (cytosine(1402)-N(4))-methyltransferase RsmH [Rhodobacteraceae bacterium]|nr:16S rRNA (cytosine(1402)-N(4))-methyltransferase RsmH [Paracoccaceae bacterium]